MTGLPALQVAGKIPRDHNPRIDISPADGIAQLSHRVVVTRQAKAAALRQGRRQVAALRGPAFVNHAQLQIRYRGVQHYAEQQQLQNRWQYQRHREPPVAPDLRELLAQQRSKPATRKNLKACFHGYTASCMRRSLPHARR